LEEVCRGIPAGQVCLVGITGGSGSGKSWLAAELEKHFKERANRLSLDDFYRDQSHLSMPQRARINFDHPRSIDWEHVEGVLREGKAGRDLNVPCYCFETHSRLTKARKLPGKPLVIMDGLWLIRKRSVRSMFDCTVFLDCPAPLRLSRRLKRDTEERGRSAESVKAQFKETVAPMHRLYVEGQRYSADFVFTSPGRVEVGLLAGHLETLMSRL